VFNGHLDEKAEHKSNESSKDNLLSFLDEKTEIIRSLNGLYYMKINKYQNVSYPKLKSTQLPLFPEKYGSNRLSQISIVYCFPNFQWSLTFRTFYVCWKII
jgi:hypothetical protein